jgi:hypothetical protein
MLSVENLKRREKAGIKHIRRQHCWHLTLRERFRRDGIGGGKPLFDGFLGMDKALNQRAEEEKVFDLPAIYICIRYENNTYCISHVGTDFSPC